MGTRTSLLTAAAAALLSCGLMPLGAQTAPAPLPPDAKPAQRAAHSHKHAATSADTAPTPVPPTPVTPPEPELPKWPANEKAEEATVTWDSQGLRINASNSSLQQILSEVGTATGAKVEGMASDMRIFGAYGPGQPRDVLSQLLEGSGYNVLMIGDQGQGAPRQIVLSPRHSGDSVAKSAPTPAAEEDNDIEDQPQPEQRQGNPPFRQPFRPRAPQENQGQQPPPGQQPNPGQQPPPGQGSQQPAQPQPQPGNPPN
jgi:hypothetical protein